MKRSHDFTQTEFNEVRKKIYDQIGLSLGDEKDTMVYARLRKRLKALNLSSFDDYLRFMDNDDNERIEFIDALTTNKTNFFREPHHFEVLKQYIKQNKSPITVWSAACSSGEEPYSIAMSCADSGYKTTDVQIFASDINQTMLRQAADAVYAKERLSDISDRLRKAYCLNGVNSNAGYFKIKSSVGQYIQFFKNNLMDESWAVPKNLDVIFCRNVMIYFDKDTQTKLLKKFVDYLKPGGLYIAGHSENVPVSFKALKPLGQTVYKKITDTEKAN